MSPAPAHFQSSILPSNGLDMHVVQAGSGEPLLLLHGFPDLWVVWRPLMELLADRYRLIAPDQRGYHKTSRPTALADYRPDKMVADCVGLMDALQLDQVTLVGHDWGSLIAFWTALAHPERISRLIILNGTHPHLFQEMVWDNAEQRAASQYFKLFQSDAAVDHFTSLGAEGLIADWLQTPRDEGKMTDADIETYRTAWSEREAWQAMLNWYRASPFHIPAEGETPPVERWTEGLAGGIEVPTLLIWGEQDEVFKPVLADELTRFVVQLVRINLPGAGHVPQRDAPDACAAAISDFIG